MQPARLVAQIHDELLFEVPEAQLTPTASVVQRIMEGALPVHVLWHSIERRSCRRCAARGLADAASARQALSAGTSDVHRPACKATRLALLLLIQNYSSRWERTRGTCWSWDRFLAYLTHIFRVVLSILT